MILAVNQFYTKDMLMRGLRVGSQNTVDSVNVMMEFNFQCFVVLRTCSDGQRPEELSSCIVVHHHKKNW